MFLPEIFCVEVLVAKNGEFWQNDLEAKQWEFVRENSLGAGPV